MRREGVATRFATTFGRQSRSRPPLYGNGSLCRLDLDQVLDPGKVRDVSGVQAS